jgi:aryl-alcohol dehydrogenase-like predicted oxidoreductase
VRAAVDRACAASGVERLDMLQFHTWSYAHPSWIDALFWLDELSQEGRSAALGLTNVDTAHLRRGARQRHPVVTNQVACSLLDRRFEGPMQQLCLATGRPPPRVRHRRGRAADRALARPPEPGPDELSPPGRR